MVSKVVIKLTTTDLASDGQVIGCDREDFEDGEFSTRATTSCAIRCVPLSGVMAFRTRDEPKTIKNAAKAAFMRRDRIINGKNEPDVRHLNSCPAKCDPRERRTPGLLPAILRADRNKTTTELIKWSLATSFFSKCEHANHRRAGDHRCP
ncbi:hypothetical protein EVAR_37467_1 [Eumeta japonica]|uniref:Uncharacterized protein n=1 Tax=Eumeta variegata TaxID=151549 RepID=A0A4C1XDD3_EUMVA|nr:hypothetical protein EVAR_37467_1 [Eumeta japonica]